jgi:hypothetical protein
VSLYQDVLANRIPARSSTADRHRETVGSRAPAVVQLTPGRPFIGREPVLARLSEQLAEGDQAAAGMILVSGEAGVGKTRLLEELAARSSRQGAAVLWGGSGAHANDFACGPFAVALESYAASCSETERDELARLYPALRGFAPSRSRASPLPEASIRRMTIAT